MLVALVGNQNSGKTTLFNYLTGSHQKVGNFPGITLDIKEGKLLNHPEITIIDLPGIYSLDNYSQEEKVSLDFLLNNKVDAIINVIDGTCLSRNLLLTNELIKKNNKIILAITFIDELKSKDDLNLLEKEINQPLWLVDYKKENIINDLIKKLENQSSKLKPINIHHFEKEIEPPKFDLDKIFLHKYLAYPIMIIIFSIILFCAFYLGGNILGSAISKFFDLVKDKLFILFNNLNLNRIIISFLLDGIILGLGSLLSLAPTLLILFFCISILQDSGYLARVATIMDRILRPLGLSGRSFISFILGYGCTVSAVMSSRISVEKEEKNLLIKLVPYSLCPARLLILLAIIPLIFKEKTFIILLSFYLLANIVMILVSFIFRKKGQNVPYFILELPKYRKPSLKNAFYLMEDKLKDYLNKAFSIILLSTIVIWFLSSFNLRLEFLEENKDTSLLALVGNLLSFLWIPFNFPEPYKVTSALICGLLSKESFLSSMAILYGSLDNVIETFSLPSLISLIVFVMLYMPCIAVFSVTKKELNSVKETIKMFAIETAVAYLVSLIVYYLLLIIK